MGGATHSALSIIQGIKSSGNNVTVVIPIEKKEHNSPLLDVLNRLNIKFYSTCIEYNVYPKSETVIQKVKFLYRVAKSYTNKRRSVNFIKSLIYNEKIDIVHTNVGPVRVGFDAAHACRIPHVWHIREYGDLDFGFRYFPSKRNFQNLLAKSYVITITQDLLRYNNLDKSSKAMVIYNGVRSIGDAIYDDNKDNYFLCASRVSKEKGFAQIIRVFSTFSKSHPNFRLKIVGMGSKSYIQELKDYCRKLNIADAVIFEGYKENVSDYMKKAKALLVASPSEGFGRMTAEASFAGCLVIGKNTAGTKEIMDITGGYRFVTDKEMLDCMNIVANLSPSEYKKSALASQEIAKKCFSQEMYVKSVLNFYLQILKLRE